MNNIVFGNIEKSILQFFDEKKFSKIAVLVDENTLKDCYPIIKNSFPAHSLIEIKSGEKNKTLATCGEIWSELTTLQFDRNGLLINLGGGVIGDMGGFCASAYKRGITFINIPTTLLSMVDASVGGKTGVDFDGFKNHIGFFSEPDTVIIDPIFLNTLSDRQKKSGAAEIIKHSLISSLSFEKVMKNINQFDFSLPLIEDSVNFKKYVVENDFKESGLRKILNFGHTIGHAIESYYLEKGDILHGEAIVIGMICELYLSVEKLNFDKGEANKLVQQLLDFHSIGKIEIQEQESIVGLAIQDKKNNAGQIKCVLLDAVGSAKYDVNISSQDVLDSLNFYNSLLD